MEKPSSIMDDLRKFWLAIAVLFLCLSGLVAAAWLLYGASDTDKIEAAKTIFNAILPLIGAWVGSILAYYFGAKQAEEAKKAHDKALDLMEKRAEESQALLQRTLTIIEGWQVQQKTGK